VVPPDVRYMRLALELAWRAHGQTRPNPMVGAVVVRGGRVVGAGYHRRAGAPHAEVVALRAARRQARGATLYVTLEPCRHTGRTPPCVPAILASGIRRVVAAMEDPNPRMQGRSLRELRAAGVQTRVGLLAAQARALNEIYLTWMTRHRPFVTVKVAHSLDGKIATRAGHSRWLSGPAARAWVHQLRAQVDAIAVGVRTVLADDPRLTCRAARPSHRLGAPIRPPLRVVVDSRLRTPLTARVLRGRAPVLIATTRRASMARRRQLEALGADVVMLPARGGRVDLRGLMDELARREVTHLLIEGGGELIASALTARLVDRWISIVAPTLVGGRAAPTALGGDGVAHLRHATPLDVTAWRRVGRDLVIEARVRRP